MPPHGKSIAIRREAVEELIQSFVTVRTSIQENYDALCKLGYNYDDILKGKYATEIAVFLDSVTQDLFPLYQYGLRDLEEGLYYAASFFLETEELIAMGINQGAYHP